MVKALLWAGHSGAVLLSSCFASIDVPRTRASVDYEGLYVRLPGVRVDVDDDHVGVDLPGVEINVDGYHHHHRRRP